MDYCYHKFKGFFVRFWSLNAQFIVITWKKSNKHIIQNFSFFVWSDMKASKKQN